MKPVLFLIVGLMLLPPVAKAQVIINHAALDQLAGIAPPVMTAPPVIRKLPRKTAYRRPLPRRMRSPPRVTGAVVAAKPAPPAMPPAPKTAVQQPAVQPVVAKPVPPPPKPQPPAFAIIDFPAGGADLPNAAALKPFCAHPGGIITIDAYAPADPADPSSAARLSLSRAFAIRDALTACGVPSASIIPRANGATSKTPDAARIFAHLLSANPLSADP